jgi:hypothetical protein
MSEGVSRFVSPTPTDLIASATQILNDGGYQQITDGFPDWNTQTARLFEDKYGIVGLVVFETCGELLRTWTDLQGSVVSVISRKIGREESKAWDGYLVLLSTGVAPSEESAIESVRYNTGRVRKLVATGEDLRSPTDIERVLRPLLPLIIERASLGRETALDLLPKLLSVHDIPEDATRTLIKAFREQSSLLEALNDLQGRK